MPPVSPVTDVGPFIISCWCCCFGDIRPGDVRLLLTAEFDVGETQFDMSMALLFVVVAAEAATVVLVIIMEVKIVWLSDANADEVIIWVLLEFGIEDRDEEGALPLMLMLFDEEMLFGTAFDTGVWMGCCCCNG